MRIVAHYGHLEVQGTKLVDRSGHPVVLRGMSLFWSQWQPQFFNAEVVRWLCDDWGVDVVRAPLAIHQGGYLEHPVRERKKIETVIEAAIDSEVYVIVDWHTHEKEEHHAVRFFGSIAKTYGEYPNLIYEIWNEPSGAYRWHRDIRPYHEEVISEIRSHGSKNVIVVGTPNWCQKVDVAAADPLQEKNIAYSLHFYAKSHRKELRARAQRALTQNIALMVTEWGTCDASGDGVVDRRETVRWWKFLEQNMISFVNWSIADKDEAAAALRPGASALGNWPINMLSPSGLFVRHYLRHKKKLEQY